jgi:hypothetical protein
MKTQKSKFTIDPNKPFFIFDTRGEWHATLLNGCLWDTRGEYIGFVRGNNHDVYTAHGAWIGNLHKDGRIVRKRVSEPQPPLKIRRLRPQRPSLPPRAPLPPSTTDLDHHFIDVLEWDPEAFDYVPDLKRDMD